MPTAAGGQLHRQDPAGASAALGLGTAGRDTSSLWRGGKREPQWSPRPGRGPGRGPSPDPRSRQPLPQSGDTHGHTTPSDEPRGPSGPAAVRYLVRLRSANLHRRPSAPGAAILRPAPRPRPPIGCPPPPLPARAAMAEALRRRGLPGNAEPAPPAGRWQQPQLPCVCYRGRVPPRAQLGCWLGKARKAAGALHRGTKLHVCP